VSIEDGSAHPDGRHARRDRNRAAVLDAAIELFFEGNPRPRPEEVAQRAGVSLRSLYRYYGDVSDLYSAAMAHNFERAAPAAFIAEVGQGPLDERIKRAVKGRLALYEALAPTVRVARAGALQNELIHERFDTGRDLLRQQIEAHFAPELDVLPSAQRAAVAAAVDVICQLETLQYLRADRGLSVRQTAQTMSTALAALLDPRHGEGVSG
jgi:AcrR family transcriptional regulator